MSAHEHDPHDGHRHAPPTGASRKSLGLRVIQEEPPAGALDQFQTSGRLARAHARDVDNMQGSARRRRVGDHFLHGGDRAVRIDRAAYVNRNRNTPVRRQLKQLQDLLPARRRHVGDTEADSDRPFVQADSNAVVDR